MAEDTLTAQLKSLEAQIAVLKGQIGAAPSCKAFADFYGVFAGVAASTEEEIDAALYRSPSAEQGDV